MAGTPKPFTRWTADTRTAFLLALKLHGTVKGAAAAVGRKPEACHAVRRRDADFAARWDAVVAEVQADWIAARAEAAAVDPAGAREGRERHDGWTETKRRRFLTMLSREGSVTEACRAVGLSTTSAYLHRRRSARFAAAWEQALAERSLSPVEAAYARAVEGWLEPVVFQGQVVAHKRRYSDSALRLLIQREDKRAAEAATRATAASEREGTRSASREETNAALMKLLAGAKKRAGWEAREAAEAFAERMVREGKAP